MATDATIPYSAWHRRADGSAMLVCGRETLTPDQVKDLERQVTDLKERMRGAPLDEWQRLYREGLPLLDRWEAVQRAGRQPREDYGLW